MPHTHYYLNSSQQDEPVLDTSQLHVIYTGFIKDDPEFIAPTHSHDFCEILYVLNGSGKTTADGKEYSITQGDLIIMNAGILHQEASKKADGFNVVFLAIDNFKVNDLEKNHLIPKGCPCVISGQDYRYKIESYFSDLISEMSNQIELSSYMSKNLVGALLVLIIRLYLSLDEKQSEFQQECNQIKDYIDRNYTNPITLDSLSEQVYISKYYLSHIFKTQTGTSPIKYLINKRISEAVHLLITTDLSIKDISYRVGYDDPVYFSQMFKKIKECSPASYRSKYRV